MKEKLTGAVYHAENSSAWAREIADEVKLRLKGAVKAYVCTPSSKLVDGTPEVSRRALFDRRAKVDQI